MRLRCLHGPVTVVLCGFLLACKVPDSERHEAQLLSIAGSTMGTTWSLAWVDVSDEHARASTDNCDLCDAVATDGSTVLQREINRELERINALMSTWDPESELSRFNQLRSTETVKLHADTLEVIDAALIISTLTAGRYDITLQPVIDLWGFNQNITTPTPSDEKIEDVLGSTGYLNLVRVADTVRKRKPEISVDVSSLAKGFAVDRLGELVESLGVSNYIVDIGGEVRARGTRADGSHWLVGIENPAGGVELGVRLIDSHIATSGSYRNFRMENGKRLSHIIDGATGKPITHNLVSVSVVHDSTMLADAWATALMVVGEKHAKKLMNDQRLVAQLMTYEDGKFERYSNAAFQQLTVSN